MCVHLGNRLHIVGSGCSLAAHPEMHTAPPPPPPPISGLQMFAALLRAPAAPLGPCLIQDMASYLTGLHTLSNPSSKARDSSRTEAQRC